MEKRAVVDANVVAKWYLVEKFSEQAPRLRDMHVSGEIELVAPELLIFEVLNAIRYSGAFSLKELQQVATSLLSYGIRFYPIKRNLAERVVEISVENDITVYDASYIALSEELGAVMYTADESFIKRVKKRHKRVVKHISEL